MGEVALRLGHLEPVEVDEHQAPVAREHGRGDRAPWLSTRRRGVSSSTQARSTASDASMNASSTTPGVVGSAATPATCRPTARASSRRSRTRSTTTPLPWRSASRLPTSTAREIAPSTRPGSPSGVPGTQAVVSSPVCTSNPSGCGIPGPPARPRPSGEAHRPVIAAWTAAPSVRG